MVRRLGMDSSSEYSYEVVWPSEDAGRKIYLAHHGPSEPFNPLNHLGGWLGPVGTGWDWLGLVGTGWEGLGGFGRAVGTSWDGLGLVGNGWDCLGGFGRVWVGTSWQGFEGFVNIKQIRPILTNFDTC